MLFSKSQLFEHYETILESKRYLIEKTMKKREASSTVFLSHKHSDKAESLQFYAILKSLGANVYIDWLDRGMSVKTNAATGEVIKDKIKQNDKFILLATDAAIESKWCNWELGYGDAHKYSEKIALFPLKEDDSDWKGHEYMGIYSVIEYQKGSHRYLDGSNIAQGFYVCSPPIGESFRNIQPLKEWLLQ